MNLEIFSLISFLIGILTYKSFLFKIFLSFLPLFFLPKLNKRIFSYFYFFLFLGFFVAHINSRKYKFDFEYQKVSEIEGNVLTVKERPFKKVITILAKKIYVENKFYDSNFKLILETKRKREFLKGENLKIKGIKLENIVPPRNPYEFNYKKFLERQGIFLKGKSDDIEIIEEKPNLQLHLSLLRRRIEKRIEKYMKFNQDGYELIKLITIGNDDVPDFLREIGIRSGIYHLFVISGIHIIFIVLLFKIIFIPFQKINNVNPKIFPIFLLSFLWFYNFLCGFRMPITRVVLMFTFYLVSEILGIEIEPLKSLIFASFFLILLNPFNIYNLSFWLSIISTAGILVIYKRIDFEKRNFITNSLFATLSAQISILPILFFNFHYFYPVGILTNLIFTPFTGILLCLSFISFFIPVFYLPLNFLTNIFLKTLILISNISPRIDFYYPLPFVFIYYFLLILFLLPVKRNTKIAFAFLALFLLFYPFTMKSKKEEVLFFSFKNPVVLINSEGKGILIIKGKIGNPEYFYDVFYKLTRSEKIRIKKIILVDEESKSNLFFISKFCNEFVYLAQNFSENEVIKTGKIEVDFLNKNIIIKYGKMKILILFDENISGLDINDKFFLIYVDKFQKKKIGVGVIDSMRPLFIILPKDIKKFENLNGLCQNYYLEKSDIVLDLKSKKIEYWGKE